MASLFTHVEMGSLDVVAEEKKEAKGRSRSRLTVREKSDIKSDTELEEP
jgi:hypothetical protein